MLRFILAATVCCSCSAANLAISTYFKDGFTPTAMASDAAGNIYVAGTATLDSQSPAASAAVAKFDPKASQYLYLTFLDAAASDQVSAIAVDGAGNAYIAGSSSNPNFPVLGGAQLGTPPAGAQDQRAFVAKLAPDGAVVFAIFLGGSTAAAARGIALTPQGQILVSGLASASGFPSTQGAYSAADSKNHWFLMELDATASKVMFSATGIGGSSIALDSAGNIYLAGSSVGTDYPTTPGAYQTTFAQGHICYGLCQIGFNGVLQHVTKVDPSGSRLIYSTGLNDTSGSAGSTINTGLAVDAAGSAYVTGTLFEAQYPFTVPTPGSYYGFLTKLNADGSAALFSIPYGGGGVQLDSSGAVYVAGAVSSYTPLAFISITRVAPPAVFSWVPQACWPNNIAAISETFVMQIDPTTGNVTGAQWIDGSAPLPIAMTLADGKVWVTGFTPGADVPSTPGTVSPQSIGPEYAAGAFLSAVDFSAPAAGPMIACVTDGGNFTHVGAVAPFQLITLFGNNLGSATITFDDQPAQVLYSSPAQVNVAVPVPPPPPANVVAPSPNSTVMELSANGTKLQRRFPLTRSNLNIFADLSSNEVACPRTGFIANGFQPLAVNSDGTMNSCANPAKFGSIISFFVHGSGTTAQRLLDLQAYVGACSEMVENASQINAFVYQVDVRLPSTLLPCAEAYSVSQAENSFNVFLSRSAEFMGPRIVPVPTGPIINFSPGQPMPMVIWVTQ